MGSLFIPYGEIRGAEGLVGQAATAAGEVVQPLLEGSFHIVKGADVHPGGGAQLLEVDGVLVVFHVKDFVRPEGGQHLGAKALVLRQQLVVLQVVGGVIRGAQGPDLAGGNQGAGCALGALQDAVGLVPDGGGALAVQQLLYAEKAQQLQVGPVVDGVAHQGRHHGGEALEFLPEGTGTRHIFLRYAAGAHHPPFVVVAGQPGLANVGELLVFVNLLGIQVAVVVKDGHVLGILMVQPAGRFAVEQKVVSNEGFHNKSSFPKRMQITQPAEEGNLPFPLFY